MERIDNSNTWQYTPSDVLISVREPYNKNTLWIFPKDDIFEIRVFKNGWKTISTNKDTGLSNLSKEWILNNLDSFFEKIKKIIGLLSSTTLVQKNKIKELEGRIVELENKFEKLSKRYSTLLVKNK